nr:immunoglobulin heavy chain junction region [Macaca mulatta]MOW24219.1 immunoglobulin heavy chain junction region [Macaca mulatta]MOW25024.1 immunoglobulin heavy chain junction region [Macaca mulatta]MOW25136.1 immunoglobulin heavy chain junction region [Macaca mulatta]MOW25316.1 immunoglobulin heavy chain junction region [Macaca mulatta]
CVRLSQVYGLDSW